MSEVSTDGLKRNIIALGDGNFSVRFLVMEGGELLRYAVNVDSSGRWSIRQGGDLCDDIDSLTSARRRWRGVYLSTADFKADKVVTFVDLLTALLRVADLPDDYDGGSEGD